MVIGRPRDARLGAARVPLALARQFETQGHYVTVLTASEVRSDWGRPRLRGLIGRSFASAARGRVASIARNYDVIDAGDGDLPFTKEALNFSGLMVVRSAGLAPLYHEYRTFERRRWPDRRGHRLLLPLRLRQEGRALNRAFRSVRYADRVFVLNEAERDFIGSLGLDAGVELLPNGVSWTEILALRAAGASVERRHEARQLAFVGYWSPRKGSRDWNAIGARVLSTFPDTHFLFLGTWAERAVVLRDLPNLPPGQVEVVPSYSPEELPQLLREATLGVMPSYIEGFPLASLEFVAAGIPPMAYESPGTSELPRRISPRLLAAVGDAEGLADRIVEILRTDIVDYRSLAAKTTELGERYTWDKIAEQTLRVYRQGVAELPARGELPR